MHGINILGYSKEGIGKINTKRISDNTKKLFQKCQNKMIIKLNKFDIGLNSLKDKYISFAFEKYIKDNFSFYYFRILLKKPGNNYIIYPLDTNKENFCETNYNKCYFLLKNKYNDLSNKILIYGYGENEISYKVFYINEADYYSSYLNLDNLKEVKKIESFNSHLILDLKTNENFALIVIESNSNESKYLTILSRFYNQANSSNIDIYSNQLYHLSEKEIQLFYLYKSLLKEYRILINITEGEGFICFNKICDNKDFIQLTKQKIYSFSISDKKNFFIRANINLTYDIKMIYDISNKVIKELNYQYNFESINLNEEEVFPLIYFIKDVKYNGININFYFKFDNIDNIDNNTLIIKGYGLDYSEISLIKNKNYIKKIDFQNEIKGKYDNITKSGSIELNNEFIKSKYKENYKCTDDKYFLIIIENITFFNFKNLRNDIYVFSKDENNFLLPINKYIKNSFNLLENNKIIQKYFFEKEKIINNEFILEFSSNYNNIELIFNSLIEKKTHKIVGGFSQYTLSINSDNSNDYSFNILIKSKSMLNLENNLKEVNIMIKYYNKEKKINLDNIYNKTIKLKK